MDSVVVVTPAAFFAFLAVVLLVPMWLSHRSRLASLRLIGDIAGKGQTLEPAVIDRLLARPPAPVGKWFAILCLLVGVAGSAAGLAIGASSFLFAEPLGLGDASRAGMRVGSLVNLCIGAGYLTLGVMSLRYFAGRTRPAPKWDFGTALALACLFFGVGGLAVGAALTAGAAQYSASVAESAGTSAGMLVGALVNLCMGAGLTILGVIIFRLFDERQES